jgi:hypothetical protein
MLDRPGPFAHEVRAKLAGSQTHDCSVNGDGVQDIWRLGSEMNESPELVLERLLVLLLTREKVALCKFWTLETLEV